MRTGEFLIRGAARLGLKPLRTVSLVFFLATVAVPVSGQAFAEARDREDRTALRGSLRDSDSSSEPKKSSSESDTKPKSASSGEKPKDEKPDANRYFQVEFTIPFAYTNRAVRAETDTGGAAKGDYYAFPDLMLKWSHQLAWVKLTASLDLGTDRYRQELDANGNAAIWVAKVQWTDGKSDYFIPYLAYVSTTLFDREMRWVDLAVNDAVVGFSSSIGIDPKGRLVELSEASKPGSLGFTLDARIGQRFSESISSQFRFVQASIEGALVLTKELTISATPKVRVRWYDDYYDEFRRDIRIGGALKVTWTPEWLTKRLSRSELTLALNMYRNFSNIPEENYLLWDVGPSLAMKWKF